MIGGDHRPTSVELIGVGGTETGAGSGHSSGAEPDPPTGRRRRAAVVALVVVALVFVQLTRTDIGSPDQPVGEPPLPLDDRESTPTELHSPDRLDALVTAGSLPPELVAAEVYHAAPGPDTLRQLLRALGGVEAITVATAEGGFDLVTFSPRNPDRLAASRRSGYGPAENQDVNEAWQVTDRGEVVVSQLALTVAHDFAHFNADGSMSYWWHAGDATITNGGSGDFAARAVSLGPLPQLGDHHSDPLHPSRAVVVDETLFALTGDADYYSTNREFDSLIADRGEGQVVLADGAGWSWVDSPAPGVAVTYPVSDDDTTVVWSTSTFERVDDHVLAGRSYRRAAVSGDGTTLVGITFGGTLEVVDSRTDRVTARFGQVDPDGIANPITLNHDGTIAVTVDHDGTVTIWWVGDPNPIAVIEGDAGPPRLLSEYRAPRVSSAVAPGAVRAAVRNRARPDTVTSWWIVDTDPARWVNAACERAGRSLNMGERAELGIDRVPPACP